MNSKPDTIWIYLLMLIAVMSFGVLACNDDEHDWDLDNCLVPPPPDLELCEIDPETEEQVDPDCVDEKPPPPPDPEIEFEVDIVRVLACLRDGDYPLPMIERDGDGR